MAGIPVSGASFGLAAGEPAGLTPASTPTERVAAYSGMSYTSSASCIILKMPMFDEFWDIKEDDPTVCDNEDEILDSYKTNQKVAPSRMWFYFDKNDPLIILFNELRASRTDIGTFEFTHSNGTDKVWGQILVSRTKEDPSDTTGKVKFEVEFNFKKKPVRN